MNPKYSDTQRQRGAGHVTDRMQLQHYSGRNPGIDSQATYIGNQARMINIGQLFRRFEVRCEPDLWQSLPVSRFEKLAQGETYRSLQDQLSKLAKTRTEQSLEDSNINELLSDMPGFENLGDSKEGLKEDLDGETMRFDGLGEIPQKTNTAGQLRRAIQKLKETELKSFWKQGCDAQTASRTYHCRGVDQTFPRLRPVLPDRRTLADLLQIPARMRSEAGRNAVMALFSLYNSGSEVYRPGLEDYRCSCSRRRTYV